LFFNASNPLPLSLNSLIFFIFHLFFPFFSHKKKEQNKEIEPFSFSPHCLDANTGPLTCRRRRHRHPRTAAAAVILDSSSLIPHSAGAPRLQPPSKESTIVAVQVVGSASVSPDVCCAVVPPFTVLRRRPAAAPSSDWARRRGCLKNRASWMTSDYSKATTRKWMGLLVIDKQEGEERVEMRPSIRRKQLSTLCGVFCVFISSSYLLGEHSFYRKE
ncbi:hypothetical protein LINPERHAP1_LOCUS13232, partial [Linum perenne]